jgi:hypothetical protein
VLRAVTGSSEGAEVVLHGSSMAVVEISGTEGRRVEEEERRLHGGDWASFLAARGGGRVRGNGGR